jgi:hypothetical protein
MGVVLPSTLPSSSGVADFEPSTCASTVRLGCALSLSGHSPPKVFNLVRVTCFMKRDLLWSTVTHFNISLGRYTFTRTPEILFPIGLMRLYHWSSAVLGQRDYVVFLCLTRNARKRSRSAYQCSLQRLHRMEDARFDFVIAHVRRLFRSLKTISVDSYDRFPQNHCGALP